MKEKHSRLIEDVGFLVAVLLVGAYGAVEVGVHAGLLHPEVHDHSIPWPMVIGVGALILPKTLGRASAGRIWGIALTRFGRRSNDRRD